MQGTPSKEKERLRESLKKITADFYGSGTNIPESKRIDRYIRMPEVQHITGLSRGLIYLMVSRGEFPKQVKIGSRASAWIESEVRQWMEDRLADRGSVNNSEVV